MEYVGVDGIGIVIHRYLSEGPKKHKKSKQEIGLIFKKDKRIKDVGSDRCF